MTVRELLELLAGVDLDAPIEVITMIREVPYYVDPEAFTVRASEHLVTFAVGHGA